MGNMKKGFTIVELLIVVVVIAILAAVTIVAYNGISQRGRVSALQSELSQAGKALEARKIADSAYPAALADVGVTSDKLTYYYNSRANTFCVDGKDGTIEYSVASNSTGAPVEATCINRDMAVWLQLNGNLTDSSGNGRTVTPSNGPTATVGATGQANTAYAFNGSDQYLTIANADVIPADTTNYTVSVWAKGIAPGSTDYAYFAIRGATTSIGSSVFWLGTITGVNQYISSAANGRYGSGASTVSSTAGAWRHVVLVFAGNYQTTYVDGVQRTDTSNGATAVATTGTVLTLGGGTAGFRDLVGALDDFRVYNRALSASEVTALFTAGAR